MKNQLDFNIQTANYLEKGNNFIQRFASAYMYLEAKTNPAEIFYNPDVGGCCVGCGSGGEKHSCKKDRLAAKRCGFFFLFNTMCGNSALRRRFDGTPTEMQMLTGEYDQYCGSYFTIDFLFGYSGYKYRKCGAPDAFKNEIIMSIDAGKPVIVKNKLGAFQLITGYDDDVLLIPPFVDYNNSTNPPTEVWEQPPSYDEIDVLYIFGEKTKQRHTIKDGFYNIRRVMEYNISEGLWDEYLKKLSVDELEKADPAERKSRAQHLAETNMYMYNIVSFDGALNWERLPGHYLYKEMLEPPLHNILTGIQEPHNDILNAGHKTGILNRERIWLDGSEEKKYPVKVGAWPLTEAHDPSLDDAGIPEGAFLYGLFDENYGKYSPPDNIDGFTQIASLSELRQNCYCVLNASSGFDYVVAMTDKPENVSFTLKFNAPLLADLSAEICDELAKAKDADIKLLGVINQAIDFLENNENQIIQSSTQPTAIFSGVWPLTEGTYDPALNGTGIPDGAAVFALIDENYNKYEPTECIDGFTEVAEPSALKLGCYCVLRASSGFDYVVLMTDNPESVSVQMRELPESGSNANTVKSYNIVPDAMVVRIPDFRAVSSGYLTWDEMFGENGFDKWHQAHPHLLESVIFDCPDFMWQQGDKPCWIWKVKDSVSPADTAPYEIIDFKGGLYAVAMCVDGDEVSSGKVNKKIHEWVSHTENFEFDLTRETMAHMIYPDEDIKQGLGYNQLNMYVPIKLKGEDNGFVQLEDKIRTALSGDMRKNALDFIAWVKTNGMTLDVKTTQFYYLNKEVCCLTLDGDSHPAGPWSIYWGDFDIYEDDDYKADEQLKKFTLANIHFCSTGHCDNSPGKKRMIFNNKYDNVCYCSLHFPIPGAEALENIKKLAELRKANITVEIKCAD